MGIEKDCQFYGYLILNYVLCILIYYYSVLGEINF